MDAKKLADQMPSLVQEICKEINAEIIDLAQDAEGKVELSHTCETKDGASVKISIVVDFAHPTPED